MTRRPSVGIGVTTRNRNDVVANTLHQIRRHSAGTTIVVVDDASEIPVENATFRFDGQVGVARAKNKCLELLVDAGCTELFLFDDDAWPIVDGWWRPYVKSPEPHLMRIFRDLATDRKLHDLGVVYEDDKHIAYTGARGVMLYVNVAVLDRVGGMDPEFGVWGYEHMSWSDRIHNAGLTTFRYGDIKGAEDLIYSMDEHEQVTRSVQIEQRQMLAHRNQELYRAKHHSSEFIEYREARDLILTSLLTSKVDPQRGTHMKASSLMVQDLRESVFPHAFVVLHDELDDKTSADAEFVRVTPFLNPYHQRHLSAWQYLRAHPEVRFVWCVDGTDVTMLRDPFPFMEQGLLYLGSEPQIVDCVWMRANHLAESVNRFMDAYAQRTLLNAGVIGGDRDTVMEFLHAMLNAYQDNLIDVFHHREVRDLGLDMGILNQVAYEQFEDRLVFGPQITTPFKSFEENGWSWWKHK